MKYERIQAAPLSPLAQQVSVRMRDGVQLATDVYLPGGDETPGDTILVRLPYDKNGKYTFLPLIAEYFMQHGYRVVVQDVRGKFRSEGDALLFVNEVNDGEDTLDWVVQQPWSNGRVGMWGDSYYGYTQWAAAASGHPALKAISPRVTGTGLGEPTSREGRVANVEWGVTYIYPLTHFLGNDTFGWEPDWQRKYFADQVEEYLEALGARSRSYDQWVPNVNRLPRFPNESPFSGRSVPALHTIGWWDNCAPLSWADVAAIAEHPAWDDHHHLRIEAIDHENFQLLDSDADRVEERTHEQLVEMMPRYLDPTIEFFNVYVRANGRAADVPRVTWNLAGTTEMRIDAQWPPQGVKQVSQFATAGGELSSKRPSAQTAVTWVHDPDDLVPSSVENAFAYLLDRPDESRLGDREDVLVFTTEAVSDDVDLVGPVRASARLSSTGPVADCFVRILDVAPDGSALRIARGQLQLRDAQHAETLDIDCGQLGYRLKAGHRLRVHVSSSDYPEFLPQTGTGVDPWQWGETARNTQSLIVGGAEGFELSVTVLKGDLS